MRALIFASALLFSTTAVAGSVEVIRGDTIQADGVTIRLAGIVAPNYIEPGYFDTNEWLAAFLADKQLVCSTMPTLTHNQVLGECAYQNERGQLIDLASTIARNGYARPCPSTGRDYLQEGVLAQQEQIGITATFLAPKSCF
jgi:endonuclease YncB( thermonuclease family)